MHTCPAHLYTFILFFMNISIISYLQSWYFNTCKSIYLHNCIHTSYIPLFLHNFIHTYIYACILACSYNCILVWRHAHLVKSLHICILGNFYTFNLPYLYSCIFAYFPLSYLHTCIFVYLRTCMFAYFYTYIHGYLHNCTFAYLHTYLYAYMIITFLHA